MSTSMIESLIKEMNFRVKGTEKFWNRPEGADNILQIRAAALCDDDRLSQWIINRPGSYFYRPSTREEAPWPPSHKIKSPYALGRPGRRRRGRPGT